MVGKLKRGGVFFPRPVREFAGLDLRNLNLKFSPFFTTASSIKVIATLLQITVPQLLNYTQVFGVQGFKIWPRCSIRGNIPIQDAGDIGFDLAVSLRNAKNQPTVSQQRNPTNVPWSIRRRLRGIEPLSNPKNMSKRSHRLIVQITGHVSISISIWE